MLVGSSLRSRTPPLGLGTPTRRGSTTQTKSSVSYPPPMDFYFVGGTFTTIDDPLATGGTIPQAIKRFLKRSNNVGQIVGYYNDATGSHGFLDTGGTFTAINDPLATEGTFAQGINTAGQVVGYFRDATGRYHGFLDVGGTFTTVDDPSGTLGTWATSINDSGEITGYVAIPEPSTLLMMFAALLGMAGYLMGKRLT